MARAAASLGELIKAAAPGTPCKAALAFATRCICAALYFLFLDLPTISVAETSFAAWPATNSFASWAGEPMAHLALGEHDDFERLVDRMSRLQHFAKGLAADFRAGEAVALHAIDRDVISHPGPDQAGGGGIGNPLGLMRRRLVLPLNILATIIGVDRLPFG